MFALVVAAGVYVISNRVFLRFSCSGQSLEEWEAKTQKEAFAFSYRAIKAGALVLFAAMSVLGALQFLNLVGVINFGFNGVVNLQAMAALTLMITYIILTLPTLYIAWTLRPLRAE